MMTLGIHCAKFGAMKSINWSADKNQQLISERSVSFEDVLFALQAGDLLDDLYHPNADKYAHQRLFVVAIDGYAYLVPYVESDVEIFLKTIIPSRKATKKYLGGKG